MSASSKPPLKNLFSKFEFKPDRNLANQIIRWKLIYETRDQHAETLNTPLLGCSRIGFFSKDVQALFDILGVNRDEFQKAIRQSSVDTNFKVVSDEYNLLTVYAAHVFINSSLPKDLKENTVKALIFMMLVKFFSSLMRHYLPHGVGNNRGVMEATIDSLSDKFDIKQKETSTWKLSLEARAQEVITPGNIHWNAIKSFIPDAKVIYIISDLQTRLRRKIQLIISIYFDMVKNGRMIKDTGLATDDPETGDVIIKELTNSFSGMIASISNRVLNTQQFIRADYIKIVSKLIPNVRVDMMRNLLMQFSSMATVQYQKKQGDALSRDKKYFVGYHIIIQNLIQRTYRNCILKKVDLKSRLKILETAINMYRSSRVDDPVVAQVKESLDKFVLSTRLSSREATNASLKIAFITYIILMSFDCD